MKTSLTGVLIFLCAFTIYAQVPPNDVCAANSPLLPVNSTCTNTAGSLLNATASDPGTGSCGNKRDVWYRIIVPTETRTITISVSLPNPTALSTSNTAIELFNSSSCPAGSTAFPCINITSARRFSNLTPGETYYLRVYTSAGTGSSNPYTFNICVVSNDESANAIPILPGTTLDASLEGASGLSLMPVDCATGSPDDDVFYKFTAIYNYATITVSNHAADLLASGSRIQLFSGTPGSFTTIACGSNTINIATLSPGTEYYFRVYSAGAGQTGTGWGFKVSVSPSAAVPVVAGRMKEVYNQQILSPAQILSDPWEVTYGPDDHLWITEAKGYRVYRVNTVTGVKDTILDISQNSTFLPLGDRIFNCQFGNGSGAQGGCAGLALHPKFLDATDPQNYVYLAYVYSKTSSTVFVNRVVRFEYDPVAKRMGSPVSICDTLPGSSDHNSQRMIIAPVGGTNYLFYASGDMGSGQFGNALRPQKAQLIDSYEGKILRFNLEQDGDAGLLDKWIPSTGSGDETNPYNAVLGEQSAVWAIGLRNNQGFAYDPVLDKLYGSSHGPYSDDEINVIERGKNYGHPLVIGYAADGNVNGTTAGAAPNFSPPHPSSCPLINDEAANALGLGSAYKDPLFSGYPNSNDFPSIFNLWNTTAGANAKWPSEGWSGLALYPHKLIPGWSKSLIATSLKWGRLVRVRLNTSGTLTAPTNTAADTVSYFGSINRFRDVAFAEEGKDAYVIMDKSTSTSGPSALNPIVPACQGCIQKYTFLGYADNAGQSSIPTEISVTAGVSNSCNNGTTININHVNNSYWVPITGPDGNIMAEIKANGQNLGSITSSFYTNSGAVRSKNGASYADRSVTINPQFQPGGTVNIRLYLTKDEYETFDADPLSGITTTSDVRIHKNSDPCQSMLGGATTIINPTFAGLHGSDYVFQADITGFSTFYIASNTMLLPMNTMEFKGHYKTGTAYLSWKAENETNTAYYKVERSNGNNQFETIAKVHAKSNIHGTNSYQLNDAEAAHLGVARLYYRLRVTDKDGSYGYSTVVVIDIPGTFITKLSIFPNPAIKQTTVMIVSPDEQLIRWQLVDVSGRPVIFKDEKLRKGENRIILDLTKLQAGVYFLQVNGQYINAQEKIQKL